MVSTDKQYYGRGDGWWVNDGNIIAGWGGQIKLEYDIDLETKIKRSHLMVMQYSLMVT